ncbi:MAG: hypothetical protein HYV40_04380 [Candidatus Levybacteria bacterium]|nr:hypothetical protein [Candidatus Levybacteria bacterium]
MAGLAEGEPREVAIYNGAPMEKVSVPGVLAESQERGVLAEILDEQRYYVEGDIVVSNFGIVGFILMDSRPSPRSVTYEIDDWVMPRNEPPGRLEKICEQDPIRRAHFVDTVKGFRMFRYFALPQRVRDFFLEGDEWLGEPMIHKCIQAGTLHKEFDEEHAKLDYAIDWGVAHSRPKIVDEIIRQEIPEANEDAYSITANVGHYVYLSYHPWVVYPPVVSEGRESILRAMANFDRVLSQSPQSGAVTKRGLEKILSSSELPVLSSQTT